jgi:hypothetical protein
MTGKYDDGRHVLAVRGSLRGTEVAELFYTLSARGEAFPSIVYANRSDAVPDNAVSGYGEPYCRIDLAQFAPTGSVASR